MPASATDRSAAGRGTPGQRGPERGGRSPVPRHVVGGALLIAVLLVLLGLSHPAFRTEEGALATPFAAVPAVVATWLILALSLGTSWAAAGRWLALAIVGQAASLQLMEAGSLLGYQHYPPPRELLSGANAGALLTLGVQAAAVSVAGGRRVGRWVGAVRRQLGAWRFGAVLAAFVLTSAAASANLFVYVTELAFATLVQAVALATVVLAMAAVPLHGAESVRAGLDRMFGDPVGTPQPGGIDRFALVAAASVLVAGAVLAWFVYQAHPHVPDEVVYLYHARYFAEGMLWMPAPPVPAAFDVDLMMYEADRWYSPVPPGWPAVLAVGAFLGAPWLVNPLLNAANVLLTYVLLRELYDIRTTRIATLLLGVSPWFVFMGMNFMTHTLTLTCGLAAGFAVARLRRGASLGWVLPGGAGIGLLGLIRPLEGLTVAVLLGLWCAGPWRWTRGRLARLTALAAVAIAVGAITLPYNAQLAGDPLTFPLMAYTDSVYGPGSNALGFGPNRGLGWSGLDPFPGHGPLDVVVNANLNLHSVNVETLGWPIGSLLPLLLLVAAGRLSRADRRLLTVIAAIIAVHAFYWFSGGPDFGARYWYLIIVPLIALTARASLLVAERFGDAEDASSRETGTAPRPRWLHERMLAGMLALSLSALLCFFPWRAIDKYYHYRTMRPDVRQLAARHDFGRSIVLVRTDRRIDYASAAIYNPIDLDADGPVYIWDRDAATTREALLSFPDRPVWILDGPRRTGSGFRVVAGPLPAGSATVDPGPGL
ncbi:MAG TPA: hypothetical protein VFZ69_16010 [Longimicrobiales bacterium]